MDYPEDMSWWQNVSTPEEFCAVGKFGPATKGHFETFVASVASIDGQFDDKDVRFYVKNDLKRMFGGETPLSFEKYSVNYLVMIWIMIMRKYDKRHLSAEEIDDAGHLVATLVSSTEELESPQRNADYNKVASAFELSELTTSTGVYASDSVYKELLGQYTSYSRKPGRYIAPYTAVVGPSGIGKSFAVKQLAVRHGLYVMYSNLAQPTSQGYPRPVAMGKAPVQVKMMEEEMVTQWETYLRTQIAIAKCCKEAGITPSGLFELLTSLRGAIPSIREGRQRHYRANVKGEETNWQLVKDELEKLGLNRPPSLLSADPNSPVIICFDEARALLDDNAISFRRLRTAAANLSKDSAIFVVLLDTTSKITNFSPPLRQDASAKINKKTLFHPIFQIDTFNIFSQHAVALEPTGEDEAMVQLLSYGRPLWGAFLQAGDNWQNLVHFAMDKIEAQPDPLAYGIALLAYRMNFYVCSPTLAETLVAASMRCIVSIAKDRDNLITTVPSEPVLALAASRLLSVSATRLKAIRAWIRAMRAGLVNPGDIGEQVASLILLFASDTASVPQEAAGKQPSDTTTDADALTAVPFARLMVALLGDEVWQTVREQDCRPATHAILSTGKVFYNHFVRTTAVPTRAVLEAAYKRGAALFLPCNFAGVDVLLPIRMPGGGMAALLIQVKNRRNDSATPGLTLYMDEAMAKAQKALGLSLGPSGDLQGMVGLVMCLRTLHEPQFVPFPPTVPATQHRAKRTRKGKEKVVDAVPETVELLGMAFGLDLSVYPSMQTPGASSPAALGDASEICRLLKDLLENGPDAFAEEDVGSDYAQRLLDPFYGL